MSKKQIKLEIDRWFDFRKVLKVSLIDELKWYEDELNELYLYKDDYNRYDVKQAKVILKKIRNLEDLCIDRQLFYLVDQTLRKIRNKYPEFFDLV